MENTSYENETYIFNYGIWNANIVISGILTVVSAYIITALAYHESRIESKRDKFSRLSVEHKFALISKFLCILIAVISLFRNLTGIGLLLVEIQEELMGNISTAQRSTLEIGCNVLARIGNMLVSLGLGFVYLFLWFRQRIFFVHPSLKVLYNKIVRCASFGIIVVWFMYYTSAGICYWTLVQYHFNHDCLVVPSTVRSYFYLILFWGVVAFLMQIALLALFLYPILKKTSWQNQKTSRNSDLMKRVKKAVALTCTCLISDILFTAITVVLHTYNTSGIFATFSINLVVNQLVTVGCFDNWQLLLWPWKLRSKNRNLGEQVESSKTRNQSAATNQTPTSETRNSQLVYSPDALSSPLK